MIRIYLIKQLHYLKKMRKIKEINIFYTKYFANKKETLANIKYIKKKSNELYQINKRHITKQVRREC